MLHEMNTYKKLYQKRDVNHCVLVYCKKKTPKYLNASFEGGYVQLEQRCALIATYGRQNIPLFRPPFKSPASQIKPPFSVRD